MSVAPETAIEIGHLLMQHRMQGDVAVELGLLVARRQFAVKQQVADFQEVRIFRELFDRVAAVQQNAIIAVDIGDLGFAAASCNEARIVSEIPRFRS